MARPSGTGAARRAAPARHPEGGVPTVARGRWGRTGIRAPLIRWGV
ncbi:hypothetical protein SFR_0188 [Streptomyces sp. FR-008]|nr:hypothetical protein SFR_0188 [Streptomyces sp. FR-008]